MACLRIITYCMYVLLVIVSSMSVSYFFSSSCRLIFFPVHSVINRNSPPLWKETQKKQKTNRSEISLEAGARGVGWEPAAARVSASTGLVHCRPRAAGPPAAVISWLSGEKEMAKQGTVYLRRLYSLHIPAAAPRHHSNLPGSGKKGPADLLPTTVCIEVPGAQINSWRYPGQRRSWHPVPSPCLLLTRLHYNTVEFNVSDA